MSNSQASKSVKGMEKYFFRASPADFAKIPGSPIAYWVNENVTSSFQRYPDLFKFGETREGLTTGSNDLFLRHWYEVNLENIGFAFEDRKAASDSGLDWFPYNKGGDVVKWYGNADYVVNWRNDGEVLQTRKHSSGRIWAHNFNLEYIFRESISWTAISNKGLGFRYFPKGFLFDANGLSFFPHESKKLLSLIATLNSSIGEYFAKIVNSSMKFNAGDIGRIPINETVESQAEATAKRAITVTKDLWDSFETSWDFTAPPLLNPDYSQPTLKNTYQKLRAHWGEMTMEMQRLEQENNRIFIDAYGLQDELTPEVPLNEITLTCNPHYRYGGDKSEEELEALLLAETMRELVSYAVGCMFGRYALDKPGLILANQGETIEDYLKRVPEPSFPADDDNVIPMLDGDWFTDDIAERFRQFLRVAFGEEHYEANLQFVEKALGKNGKARDIRDYFLKDFYTDHVKRYKKRPIYWLFSSPKGSFNALIYMHRYRPDTVSVVLNDYLREFRTKLTSHKNHLEAVSISGSSSQSEKTKALKEIEKITKMIAEMEEYEREVLYPLATEQVEIDLDDGVKVNYPKLGAALKKIVGLDAKED
ncbi:TPA: BREX-1 system adenine-specific DNA-methyltransferase PglX [Pseudomonas aeruginosa]|uniref:BREX-1 system adenine-specific DNA-methyltransferase PglX n=4 Tax=Pseudomonadaceae TaxID=135621 RepID=UPI0018FE67AA|nr:BREX-1 system adenine-specific DNA-methyltransferase PglX [Pseudomonas aeruginosa]EKY4116365.1 BREX-1 system adenine-specific DNA-methyltransferase PglX [Pseudomonas aeruginosa]ELB6503739.1 BREX-1 system adenine-specific DNA-methyltransferase PglX [Pseudomonas aeruginosa]ELC0932536.1 BREX-1 system adenine-specific DNA-methyltransferase PglX [Pseudomonas aeruginosa]ELM3798409.1 BREX-1 system adenine-specific DNA-methyltransferase PglX [Pseudomonas aeruginosa]EME9701068.1 BREX-1 system adenin